MPKSGIGLSEQSIMVYIFIMREDVLDVILMCWKSFCYVSLLIWPHLDLHFIKDYWKVFDQLNLWRHDSQPNDKYHNNIFL